MAMSSSGLIVPTWLDILDTTQLAIDLDLETHKGALFSNAIANDLTTDTAYGAAPYNANEVNDAGNWPAGGVALTGTTFTNNAGSGKFGATNVSVANTTLTNARGYLLYADALAGNNAIVLINFAGDYSTVAGTFAITWDATGVFYIDFTP